MRYWHTSLDSADLERRLDVRGLVDRQFLPADIRPARIDMAETR